MKKNSRKYVAAAAALATLMVAQPAYADGDIKCNAGPTKNWKPIAKLKKQAWMEGWELLKVQVEGDCYEVYARTESGQAIEAFFHPVTLKKLVVYRRGSEIYRAPGFSN
ncbi:MAG: PepSY domain-containing protein [Parasphingorhabdus sp.]|uniref:PepSY domain-containing protein n=1 Tax=Parasphingorhabdus sp. TaxID=2709688 RepID=UPI0030013CED